MPQHLQAEFLEAAKADCPAISHAEACYVMLLQVGVELLQFLGFFRRAPGLVLDHVCFPELGHCSSHPAAYHVRALQSNEVYVLQKWNMNKFARTKIFKTELGSEGITMSLLNFSWRS